ncbi:kinesin-like protein KIN-14O isoform X2 [Physcomitrium patens]|uniref:kinesin-like protein KIN-14O isoform X2 n=1 Tax=Physcomitrium patens TaxID=3218 RepID=UPI003CCD8F89
MKYSTFPALVSICLSGEICWEDCSTEIMRTIIIPDEQDDNVKQMSPLSLSQSLDSLLGSKSSLTTEWADSVRSIMNSACGSPMTCNSCTVSLSSSSDGDNAHNRQECLDREIGKLEEELSVLRTALEVSNSLRRSSLNRILDLKGNIRVFCRIRPFLPAEKHARPGPVTNASENWVKISGRNSRKEFEFDKVFQPNSVQDDVFAEIEPIIRSALDGHNVCIFAYGQTGSGKTFTMEGSNDDPGVVPRSLRRLFEEASYDTNIQYSYSLSMLEVYKGSLRDLLVARPTRHTDATKCQLELMGTCSLSIQMGSKGFIEVENLTEIPIADVKEASRLYLKGSRRRSTAWTNANDTSSRSHCLLRINIVCKSPHDNKKRMSKLWLIDLGGSERLLKTNAQGLTMEEGRAINISLSALGDVISALHKRRPHVPYRNSKLTQILRDSLGDNSKTLMLVHVSPTETDLGETICSLSFATRVRGTHLGHDLSADAEKLKAAAMSELSKQNSIHESECQLLCNKIKSLNLLLGEKRCSLEQVKNEKMLPRDTSFTTNPQQGVSVGDTLPSLSPCNIDSEKPETDSCAISPLRKVPRFMSPTASSRGKKSPIVLCDHPMMTQQPPMTFTSGYSKRIVAPRGVLTDSPRTGLKIDTRNDITNSKRKLMERSPWPATAKKPDQSADNSVCTTTSEGPVDKTFGIKETPTPTKFTELPTNDVLTPISHSKVTEEHYSRILAAERSISKLAVSVSSSVRGSSPRSRRRLSLDCSSMNGTTKRFVF